MIYSSIEFQAAPFTYNLMFYDRITLVRGDSATGKTYLYQMLEDLRMTKEFSAIRLFNYKTEDFHESLEKCRDKFVVIDNADILLEAEDKQFINFERSNQYMLFLRNCDGLNLSANSFTILDKQENVISLKKRAGVIVKYLWTEDSGAGFHYWQLVNKYLFNNELVVESKGSNQKLLDAVRNLKTEGDDKYYIAFDIVYDNMDVTNKYIDLRTLAKRDPEHIILLDMICFEAIILSFRNLIEWTGTGRKDKIEMRKHILAALENHRINLEQIEEKKTLRFLQGFKNYSTEKV